MEFASGDLAAICAHTDRGHMLMRKYNFHSRDDPIDVKTIQYLYYYGFDMTRFVFAAIYQQSCDVMEWMLSVDIPLPTDTLDYVCFIGSMNMFNMLIQRKDVFINGRVLYDEYFDREYRSIPLFSCAVGNYIDIILQLYIHGADMSIVDNKDRNALHYSCKANNVEATKTLLDLGVSVCLDYKERFPYKLTESNEIRALFGVEHCSE